MDEVMDPNLVEAKIRTLKAEERKLDIETDRARLEYRMLEHEARSNEATSDYALRFTFYNPVVPTSVLECIKMLDLWSRREPGKDILLIFNSPGGSVTDGLALFDFIQELRGRGHKITTKCIGMAASMGAILMQAGDERVMSANAFMMVHAPSLSYGFGESRSTHFLEDDLETLKLYHVKGINILAARSKLSPEEIETRWKKADWYLDAAQALEAGLIDRIDG